MPDLICVDLKFKAGLHLGIQDVSLEGSRVVIPSDTLFAALCDAALRIGGKTAAWVEALATAPAPVRTPFRVTSAFPYAGGVRFFPRPLPLDRLVARALIRDQRKALQRVRFISEGLLRRVLAGKWLKEEELPPKEEETGQSAVVALQGGALWLLAEEMEALPAPWRRLRRRPYALRHHSVYQIQQVPRVTVERVRMASNIFHAGRVSFAPECGLWFGVAGADAAMQQALQMTLAVLADDGLGGERAVGYGVFTYEWGKSLSLPDAAPDGLGLLLSRYHPTAAELPGTLTASGTAYGLTAVGGWLRSWDGAAQRRKRLWLVREGSVIRPTAPEPWGDIVDVRPTYDNPQGDLPHPVWRYGMALAAGLKEV